jgi:hypothetical protein
MSNDRVKSGNILKNKFEKGYNEAFDRYPDDLEQILKELHFLEGIFEKDIHFILKDPILTQVF